MTGKVLRTSNGQFAGSTTGFGKGRSRPGVGGGARVRQSAIARNHKKVSAGVRKYNSKTVAYDVVKAKNGNGYNVLAVSRSQRRARIVPGVAQKQHANQIVVARNVPRSTGLKYQASSAKKIVAVGVGVYTVASISPKASRYARESMIRTAQRAAYNRAKANGSLYRGSKAIGQSVIHQATKSRSASHYSVTTLR